MWLIEKTFNISLFKSSCQEIKTLFQIFLSQFDFGILYCEDKRKLNSDIELMKKWKRFNEHIRSNTSWNVTNLLLKLSLYIWIQFTIVKCNSKTYIFFTNFSMIYILLLFGNEYIWRTSLANRFEISFVKLFKLSKIQKVIFLRLLIYFWVFFFTYISYLRI